MFQISIFVLKMFLESNEENLQLPEMVITDQMSRDYSKFMNFLMAKVYNNLFQNKFPRVLPEMKEML